MSDFPPIPDAPVTPTFIHTTMAGFSNHRLLSLHAGAGSTYAATTWTANQAVYIPMVIPFDYHVRRVFWVNGSVITTTNGCFAIYNFEGTQIYTTGSTALAGTSQPQYVDVTDFVLQPGRYYFAYNCDGTTTRVWATSPATIDLRQSGILQQAVGAIALPATMASAVAATATLLPICGVTRTNTGF